MRVSLQSQDSGRCDPAGPGSAPSQPLGHPGGVGLAGPAALVLAPCHPPLLPPVLVPRLRGGRDGPWAQTEPEVQCIPILYMQDTLLRGRHPDFALEDLTGKEGQSLGISR